VTHYDASKKHGQLELIATPTHTETIIVTQQKQQQLPPASTTSVTTTTTTSASQLPVSPARLPATKNLCNSSSSGNNSKLLIGLAPFLASNSNSGSNNNSQLMLPHHNPHLYHSQEALNLFSSIGVPNYTESFAVDPNEILHKEKFIKSEPSTPTPTDFRPVFHNVRVPTKEDLLFKVEPMVTSSCQIKLETEIADSAVPMTSSPPTTASSHQLLMSPETEGISVNDIKKEVLSELFDCEPEYSSSDDSFLDGAYEDTTMHYSDDSQEDFAGCLLSSGYDESSICQEGDGSAASGQSSNHNLDLSLKLEALSPMSSFEAEPVPQTPEFFTNREDVFK
jgi:hypothetical protein